MFPHGIRHRQIGLFLVPAVTFVLSLSSCSIPTNSTTPRTSAAVAEQATAAPQPEFDWANNTYYAGDDYSGGTHFGLKKDSPLKKDDAVLLLDRVHSPEKMAKVLEIIDPAPTREMLKEQVRERGFQSVFEDKKLWNQIRWVRGFDNESEIVAVARLSRKGVLAIANPGENVIVLQGPDLTDSDDDRTLAIPRTEADVVLAKIKSSLANKSCMASNSLVTAVRYGPAQGHEVIELFVGNPAYLAKRLDKSTIDTIHICRSFIVDGQPQRLLEFERSSSKDEHVDTSPPNLTNESWLDDIDTTLAYLSVDEGRSWKRSSQNGGFEGFNYRIEDVSTGRELFHAYHFTAH
jgi:hypothetical protein